MKKELINISDQDILFLKKYVLPNMNIKTPINAKVLDEMLDLAGLWEIDDIENSKDYVGEYPHKERKQMAYQFVSRVMPLKKELINFEHLNKNLGL